MAKNEIPSPEQIRALNARAQQYGYGVDADGWILLTSGTRSSSRVWANSNGRGIRVVADRPGHEPMKLFTGDDIGKFLEGFWFAKLKPQAGALLMELNKALAPTAKRGAA